MKQLSNGRSSSKTRHARVTEHFYEPEGEENTTQKPKFASLYDEAAAEEDELEEEAGYALRQKHKKIWKISSIKNGLNTHHPQQQRQEKFVCSKCGKGFQSLKAKCGHMACHSEKEKPPSRHLVAKQKLAVDESHSDSKSGAQQLMRRSRRARYKKHSSVSAVGSKAKVVVDFNKTCSSEDSGVEQEQEEVAISLMMLSRDSANWGGLNSVDSSDNNSVVLEARSVSTKLVQKYVFGTGHRADEALKKIVSNKVTAFGDSESGFERFCAKNVEAEVNKFAEASRTEAQLSQKKLRRAMDAGLIRDGEGWYNDQSQRDNMDLYLNKSVLNEPYAAGYNVGYPYSNSEMYQRFEHNAVVHSQSHKPLNANAVNQWSFSAASSYKSGENNFETNPYLEMRKGKGILDQNVSNVSDKLKKSKHECPVCFKVFRSGQALGGHRRAHLSEGSDEYEISVSYKQNGAQLRDFIDLNLPAPMENEEASESMGSYH